MPEDGLPMGRVRLRIVLERLAKEVHRDGTEERSFGRVQLPEITNKDDVQAAERSDLAWRVFPHLVHVRHDGAQLHVDLCQELGAHHADLVDEEPTPLHHALGDVCLSLCGALGSLRPLPATEGIDATRMVDGIAAKQLCHHRLERGHLVVQPHLPAANFREEFLHELEHLGFACARTAVQQPHDRIAQWHISVLLPQLHAQLAADDAQHLQLRVLPSGLAVLLLLSTLPREPSFYIGR